MLLTRLKIGVTVVLAAALGLGGGGVAYRHAQAAGPGDGQAQEAGPGRAQADRPADPAAQKKAAAEKNALRYDLTRLAAQMDALEAQRRQTEAELQRVRAELEVLRARHEQLLQASQRLEKELLLKVRPAAQDVKPPAPKQAPGRLQGVIRDVIEDGFMMISLGSDHGVKVGQTLHAYRLDPEPTYLGPVKVLLVRPGESVAKASNAARNQVRRNDHVMDMVMATQAGAEDQLAKARKEVADLLAAARSDRARLQGTWRLVGVESGGKQLLPPDPKLGEEVARRLALHEQTWTFSGDTVTVRGGPGTMKGTYTLDGGKDPARIDVTLVRSHKDWEDQVTMLGIYSLEGNLLRLCFASDRDARRRPLRFDSKLEGGSVTCYVLQREPSADATRP